MECYYCHKDIKHPYDVEIKQTGEKHITCEGCYEALKSLNPPIPYPEIEEK